MHGRAGTSRLCRGGYRRLSLPGPSNVVLFGPYTSYLLTIPHQETLQPQPGMAFEAPGCHQDSMKAARVPAAMSSYYGPVLVPP